MNHLDGLAEVWVGLFFGVGVIWTAIGMRAALADLERRACGEGQRAGARAEDGTVLGALSLVLDAAVAVAPRMEFSPAWNRDQRVEVWIALDLVFEVLPGV